MIRAPGSGSQRVHGGPDPEELERLGLPGLEQQPLLDFSVNVSPYGRAPEVERAIREAPLDRYPDPHCRQARRALAAAWNVAPDRIAVGNGAAELLFTLVRVLCAGERGLLTVEPTFSEPAVAARAVGARWSSWRARPEDGFRVDVAAVAEVARTSGAAAVYLCNPQNPTGRVLPIEQLTALAEALAGTGSDVTLIIDEAFLGLSTRYHDAQRALPESVVRVRSFTKEHGLPGLRLGALMAAAPLVDRLEAARPTWTVSAPAQAAVAACAASEGFVAQVRSRWLADTAALGAELGALYPVHSSDSVFLLAEVGDAAALRQRLLVKHRILIRDCASFGLPRFARFAGRPADDRRRLIEALTDV